MGGGGEGVWRTSITSFYFFCVCVAWAQEKVFLSTTVCKGMCVQSCVFSMHSEGLIWSRGGSSELTHDLPVSERSDSLELAQNMTSSP